MFKTTSKLGGKTLSVQICRGPPILLGTLHPYYSIAGEAQFCYTSHDFFLLRPASAQRAGRSRKKFFAFFHFFQNFSQIY